MSWNATSPPPGFEGAPTSFSTQLRWNSGVDADANASTELPTSASTAREEPPRFGTAATATPAFQPPPGLGSAAVSNGHSAATNGAQTDDPAARFRRTEPNHAVRGFPVLCVGKGGK